MKLTPDERRARERERRRRYRKAHPDKVRAEKERYRAAHPEKVAAARKRHADRAAEIAAIVGTIDALCLAVKHLEAELLAAVLA